MSTHRARAAAAPRRSPMSVTIREVAREAAGLGRDRLPRPERQGARARGDARGASARRRERCATFRTAAARSLITRRTQHDRRPPPRPLRRVLLRAHPRHRRAARAAATTSSSRARTATARRRGAMLRAMRGRVDGLIVLSPDARTRRAPREPPGRLARRAPELRGRRGASTRINVDNYGGRVRDGAAPRGLGHRRIAFISGPAGNQRRRRSACAATATPCASSSAERRRALEIPGRLPRGGGLPARASGFGRDARARPRSSRPTTRWRSGCLCALPRSGRPRARGHRGRGLRRHPDRAVHRRRR